MIFNNNEKIDLVNDNSSYYQLKEYLNSILNFTMKAKEVAIDIINKLVRSKDYTKEKYDSIFNIILSLAKIEEEIMGLMLINRYIEEVINEVTI